MLLPFNQFKIGFAAAAGIAITCLITVGAHADVPTGELGRVKGQAVQSIDGVDHAVEYYAGSPLERTAVGQLKAQGVAVSPEDRVTAFPEPTLGLGSAITVRRATSVTIVDGTTPHVYRTWVPTVNALLFEQHIDVGKDDTLDKARDATLVDAMTVTITRVAITTIDETESVAYDTQTVNDNTMDKGTTKILQAGQDGVRTKTYQVRRENGTEVSRELVKNEITTAAVTEKKAVGTKVVVYGTGTATWYERPGHSFGAASNTLPFGTKVHVVNLANGKSVDVVIDDRGIQGSAIIDLNDTAFAQIGSLGTGVLSVRLEKYYGN